MTAAIICEFNPFHNGHEYLINEARKICGLQGRIVAIMSGNYVQRGAPAVTDKWSRTRTALNCGIDAVIELPSVYAASGAQFFAEAAVDIADKLGSVDFLIFGSESGDAEILQKVADQKVFPSREFEATLKSALKEGLAYPVAMQKALGAETPLLSNDILAVEYLCALKKSGSAIKPIVVKRGGNTKHADSDLRVEKDNITSANAIRNALCDSEKNLNSLKKYMPEKAFEEFSASLLKNGGPVTLKKYEQFIFGRILTLKPEGLSVLPFITEGLENKLYQECRNAASLEELIENCVGKRYTRTRITRALTALLTGAEQEKHFSKKIKIPYVRVLGVKSSCKDILGTISEGCKNSGTDFIPGALPPDLKGLSPDSAALLDLESTATDIYYLATPAKLSGAEFRQGLIIC